jgi:hypothetical protein
MNSQTPDPNQTQAYSFEAARAGQDRQRELSLRAVHLLLTREKIEEAERALKQHLAIYPGDPQANALWMEIRDIHGEEKWREDRRRGLRYTFGMSSSAQRFGWWVAGLIGIGYGVWQLTNYLPTALKSGMGAMITTYISRGSKYNKHYEPWTHPVSYELGLAAVGIALGTIAILLVLRIGKGAADWEGLDGSPSDAGRYGGGRWGL